MNGQPLSEEELDTIYALKMAGKTNQEIADVLHRSLRTVQRVSSKYEIAKQKADWGVQCFLTEWWHWVIPKRKPPKDEFYHSWFITPYNYPRMWKAKEE